MLKNISVRYDPEQDRLLLLLVMALPDGNEQVHAMHLTRRLCGIWRQDLQAAVDLSAQAPQSLQPALRAAVSKAHHDAQASQATVRTEKALETPQASSTPPRLVVKVQCGRSRSDGRWVIRFHLHDGGQLTLQLNSQTLHGLFDALSRRVRAADWRLPELPAERDAPASPPASGAALH